MTIETIAFLAGCLFLLIGLAGGGLEIKEVKIPKISGFVRVAAAVTGLFMLGWSFGYIETPLPPEGKHWSEEMQRERDRFLAEMRTLREIQENRKSLQEHLRQEEGQQEQRSLEEIEELNKRLKAASQREQATQRTVDRLRQRVESLERRERGVSSERVTQRWAQQLKEDKRILTGAGVFVRRTAGGKKEKCVLHFGDIVTVRSEREISGAEKWSRISWDEHREDCYIVGKTGWMSNKYLENLRRNKYEDYLRISKNKISETSKIRMLWIHFEIWSTYVIFYTASSHKHRKIRDSNLNPSLIKH